MSSEVVLASTFFPSDEEEVVIRVLAEVSEPLLLDWVDRMYHNEPEAEIVSVTDENGNEVELPKDLEEELAEKAISMYYAHKREREESLLD